MARSLLNLAEDPAEEIQKVKCKDCDIFLEYDNVKDNILIY